MSADSFHHGVEQQFRKRPVEICDLMTFVKLCDTRAFPQCSYSDRRSLKQASLALARVQGCCSFMADSHDARLSYDMLLLCCTIYRPIYRCNISHLAICLTIKRADKRMSGVDNN
jgi:hypothetical protein